MSVKRPPHSIAISSVNVEPAVARPRANDIKPDAASLHSDEIWVNKFDEAAAAAFREKATKTAMMDPSQPLIIYIDSYGGYVDALAKMIDTIDEIISKYGTTIITVCMGKAMSCGAILLSHGDIRYCGPNSRVMVHEVSSGTGGDVHDMKNDVEESVRLNEHFLGLLATNCNIKGGYKGLRKLIKDHDGRDIWLDANAALDFGIVDYVGLPRIVKMIQYTSTMPEEEETKLERKKRYARILKEAQA